LEIKQNSSSVKQANQVETMQRSVSPVQIRKRNKSQISFFEKGTLVSKEKEIENENAFKEWEKVSNIILAKDPRPAEKTA